MMPPSSRLIDSSFLYALFNTREQHHSKAVDLLKAEPMIPIIPDVVLPEVTFLFNRFGGERAVIVFLTSLERTQPHLEPLTQADLKRSRDIMAAYPQAQLDFVDCCIMAMSERLNITEICTFDRRDFSIFRPQHCEYLTLLP
jgi:uncharacterized protein